MEPPRPRRPRRPFRRRRGHGRDRDGRDHPGPAAIRERAAETLRAFPDWHIAVEDVVTSGDRACAQVVISGTQMGEFLGVPARNRRVDVAACSWFRFDDNGLIQEERIYFDAATLLGQRDA